MSNQHARSEIETSIAHLIHKRAGHVEDHEGDVGGCHRAAAEIVKMFPADVVGAREDLTELYQASQVVASERDGAVAENAHYRRGLRRIEAMLEPGGGEGFTPEAAQRAVVLIASIVRGALYDEPSPPTSGETAGEAGKP